MSVEQGVREYPSIMINTCTSERSALGYWTQSSFLAYLLLGMVHPYSKTPSFTLICLETAVFILVELFYKPVLM